MENEKRLIDANALDEKVGKLAERYAAQGRMVVAEDYNFIRTVLMTAPTVDAVEVVHGKWIDEGLGSWSCSSCLDIFTFDDYGDRHPKDDCGCNYCPNCGAKMDGGNEDG